MFLINLQGKESIYEQIRSQIEKFIEAGVLKPGDKNLKGQVSEVN